MIPRALATGVVCWSDGNVAKKILNLLTNIVTSLKKITKVLFHVPLYKLIKNSLQDQHLCHHSGRSKQHVQP